MEYVIDLNIKKRIDKEMMVLELPLTKKEYNELIEKQ